MWPLYGGGFWIALAQAGSVYYAAAVVLHILIPACFPVASIQPGSRKPGQVTREALNSLAPIAVKAAMWTVVEQLHRRGAGLLYAGRIATPAGVAYALLTIVALDYLHDAWFYWTHRLLHWAPVYRRVHYLHHQSTVPTAFAGYSFHVAEAALVFANEVLVCFLFPIHVGLHRAYHMFTTVIHNGGHAGYELAPFIPSLEALGWLAVGRGRPSPALNTVQHHDLHHRNPKVHFSLYMTHWDRVMGTEHPQYRSLVDRHFGGHASTATVGAAVVALTPSPCHIAAVTAAATSEMTVTALNEYRRGVGLCVVNRQGMVFAARRLDDRQGTWQMPQGGIDPLENPLQAALRELQEETGMTSVRIVGSIDPWLHYDFPTKVRANLSGGGWLRYRGQTQKWILLHFDGHDAEVDLQANQHPEFSEWRWMPLQELPQSVVCFKKGVYESVAYHFGPRIERLRENQWRP